jgi:hypothetical protein
MGLGMLLVIIGALFKVQHWPDIFHGLVTGPIIAIVGAVIFILTLIKKTHTL